MSSLDKDLHSATAHVFLIFQNWVQYYQTHGAFILLIKFKHTSSRPNLGVSFCGKLESEIQKRQY